MQNGHLEEAKTCNRKIDDCGVDLIKSNAKADAHNVALEACRSSIWSTVIKPAEGVNGRPILGCRGASGRKPPRVLDGDIRGRALGGLWAR